MLINILRLWFSNEKELFVLQRNIKLMDKDGSSDIGISSKNELFDPKYQFYDGKVFITEDEEEINTELSIFEDFINGNKTQYYKYIK